MRLNKQKYIDYNYIEEFSILQLLGNKRRLVPFIKKQVKPLMNDKSKLIDLFSGTSIVAYNFKNDHEVYANDISPFSYEIAKALISNNSHINLSNLIDKIKPCYDENKNKLIKSFKSEIEKEETFLSNSSTKELIDLYLNINTYPYDKFIVNKQKIKNNMFPYILFTSYYRNNYFGIKQAIEIDSIKYAIDNSKISYIKKSILHVCLFYAMNECSFSRDGHFAQVINLEKSKTRLLISRNKSIFNYFYNKLMDFSHDIIINNKMGNNSLKYSLNLNYEDALKLTEIEDKVDIVYADPPYTTNKYSRYYHLLNTLVLYDYPEISKHNGNYTKGRYRKNRNKSNFSSKIYAIKEIQKLFKICKDQKKVLAFSYAYPKNPQESNTTRYSATINDIIQSGYNIFGKSNFDINIKSFEHSNQRRKTKKLVNEYLLIGKY